MSQQLNLVSCCLSVTPGRFNDLEGRMALVTVRGWVSGSSIQELLSFKRTYYASFTSQTVEKWPQLAIERHPRQDRGEEKKGFEDAPKLPDDTITTVFECITDLYGKITPSIVVRRALLVFTGLLVERKDFGARWGDYVLVLDAGLLVRHLWDGVSGVGAGKGVTERGEKEEETEHLVSSPVTSHDSRHAAFYHSYSIQCQKLKSYSPACFSASFRNS